jgi:hypothetical protein
MISIRREDAKDWPCPWICSDNAGCSSRPEPWSLTEAVALVKESRKDSNPLAVYMVSGRRQVLVYPR